MTNNIWIYIFIMAGVSFLLRVTPLLLISKPIKNQFIQSLFYYMPYVTLSVMTVPAIFTITENPVCGAGALVTACITAWITSNLVTSAGVACLTVFLLNLI